MKFPGLVSRFTTAVLVEETKTSADTVRAWKRGEMLPSDPNKILALASVTGLPVADLLAMIAEDTKRRNAASDSRTAGAA